MTASICMFLAHPLVNDARVEKEARALTDAGYAVRVIATAFPGLPEREVRAGATVIRVDDDPLPARAVRALLRRGGRAGGGAPGTVITREATERSGARAWLTRTALRAHLRLVWRRYMRTALRTAEPAAVWIAHDLETLPLALRARRRHGGRVLYDSHELFTDSSLARGERRRWLRVERRAIGHADAVVTVSGSIAAELSRRYGIPEPEVVHNAPPAASGPLEPADLRSGFPPEARVALYAGGVLQHRGIEELLAAVAAREDLALVLLGPITASYRTELDGIVARRGIAGRVRFLPPVALEEIPAQVAGADVGLSVLQPVFLSYRYALPNKLFDYLQAGLPVVVSDFPEMRALVERHDVGATCDPGDPASILAAIDAVTADPERHAELRRNALAAAPLYTWEREREKLLAVVRRLAA